VFPIIILFDDPNPELLVKAITGNFATPNLRFIVRVTESKRKD
jgi:hypothetical protein